MNLKDLRISSTEFASLGQIPRRYTGDGKNLSLPLQWSRIPAKTQQLALICYDPDAPTSPRGFTHWLLYNILPMIGQIAEASGSKFT